MITLGDGIQEPRMHPCSLLNMSPISPSLALILLRTVIGTFFSVPTISDSNNFVLAVIFLGT